MKRIAVLLLLLVVAGGGVGLWWWLRERERAPQELALYGNVDLRQVQLAFNNSERIAKVLAQEGDRVHKGQVLARLDTSRIEPQVAQAEGEAAAQRNYVAKLHNGNRPQEKAQARANVASASADVVKARQQYDRLKKLAQVRLSDGSQVRGVSQEDLDNAKAALDVAEAKLAVNQKGLDLMLAGFRKEEIAQAESQLRVNEAKLALWRQRLADAQLLAPTEAIVRTRLMEPGEMSSPQKPVFALAIIDPKWVRAYVSETDLGKLQPGMAASVAVDSFPKRRYEGWVGFISPVAEFTPKTVQTEELRTSLVYEVRVFVKDPGDDLRLGMPATVYLPNQKVGSAADEDGR